MEGGDPVGEADDAVGAGGGGKSQGQRRKLRLKERKKKEEEEAAAAKEKADEEEAERKRMEVKRDAEKKRIDDIFVRHQERQQKKKAGRTLKLGDLDDFIAEGRSRESEEQDSGSFGGSQDPTEQSSSPEVPKHGWLHFSAKIRTRAREAAIAEAKDKGKETDDDIADLMLDFLKRHRNTNDGNNGHASVYAAQVAFMKSLGTYKLTVDFMDLLDYKEYKKLVIRIGKNDQYGWLHRAVATFVHSNGMQDESIDDLISKVSIDFMNKKCLMELDDFMSSKLKADALWRFTPNGEIPLTRRGRRSLFLVKGRIVDRHIEGFSYNGAFGKEDVLLGHDFCWIYGNLLTKQPNSSYEADFTNVWATMSPYYVVREADNMILYPLNFDVLWQTLTLQHIHISEVTSAWYRKFVRYHTTGASAAARTFYTEHTRRLIKDNPEIANEGFLSCIPNGPWQKWQKRRIEPGLDWRRIFARMKTEDYPVLKGVFGGKEETDMTRLEEKLMGTSIQTVAANTTTTSSSSKEIPQSIQTSKKKKMPQHRFTNTVWGQFNYRRCVVLHGKEHSAGKFVVESNSSTELHASHHFPYVMAHMLSSMLKQRDARFEAIMEGYFALYDVGDD